MIFLWYEGDIMEAVENKKTFGKYIKPNPQVAGPHPETIITQKATRVSNHLGFALSVDEIATLKLEIGDSCELRIINKSKQL